MPECARKCQKVPGVYIRHLEYDLLYRQCILCRADKFKRATRAFKLYSNTEVSSVLLAKQSPGFTDFPGPAWAVSDDAATELIGGISFPRPPLLRSWAKMALRSNNWRTQHSSVKTFKFMLVQSEHGGQWHDAQTVGIASTI